MIKNPYKVLIISCWGMLGFCFILKLFGADWFTAGTDNEAFIKVCNFIDERHRESLCCKRHRLFLFL